MMPEYPLSGAVQCGHCGSLLYGERRTRGESVWKYYRCGSCEAKMIPAAKLEGAVSVAVIEAYVSEPRESRRQKLIGQIKGLDPEADDYGSSLQILRDRLARVKAGIVPDGLTIADYWAGLDAAGKRDYLRKLGWKIFAEAGKARTDDPVVTIDGTDVEGLSA